MKSNAPKQSFFHRLDDVFVGSVAPLEKTQHFQGVGVLVGLSPDGEATPTLSLYPTYQFWSFQEFCPSISPPAHLRHLDSGAEIATQHTIIF